MQTQPQTSKEYFKNLTILHGMLLLMQISFFAVAYFFTDRTNVQNNDLNAIFIYLIPAVVFIGIIGSNAFFKKQLSKLTQLSNLKTMLTGYLTALLVKYALLEIPAMMAIVAYFVTANYLFLGLAAVVMMIFILNRPSIGNTIHDLCLDPDERSKVENPKAVIAEKKVR